MRSDTNSKLVATRRIAWNNNCLLLTFLAFRAIIYPVLEHHNINRTMENSTKDDYQTCRRYALKLLNVRAYTAFNLKKKLLEKEYSRESAEKVILECVERGYLNDRLWAESFARVQRGRKYGQSIIAQKLKMKGIEDSLISEVLEKYQDEAGDVENLKKLLQSRYRSRNLEEPREKQKVIASLLRRGFDYASILKSLQ